MHFELLQLAHIWAQGSQRRKIEPDLVACLEARGIPQCQECEKQLHLCHFYVVLETASNVIVTEKLADGSTTWAAQLQTWQG